MIPADADAQAQPTLAQNIDLGCLLGDEAGLSLRQDEHAAGELDALCYRREEGERREGLVEGVGLVVDRRPAVA